jgi:hypothetical protein
MAHGFLQRLLTRLRLAHPAPADELAEIRSASAGLMYPSESDQPFDLVTWPAAPGSARDRVTAHAGSGRKIAEVSVDAFFKELESADPAFTKLRKALDSELSGLQIFRAGEGETRVDIYLLGRAPSGQWAGLHTVSVET